MTCKRINPASKAMVEIHPQTVANRNGACQESLLEAQRGRFLHGPQHPSGVYMVGAKMNYLEFATGYARAFIRTRSWIFRCLSAAVPITFTTSILVSGCASPSVLISADDSTFAEAQSSLRRTTALVEKSGAPEAERVLFLQAEGFYRYRFLPPARGKAAFLAEAAASITDFPAFQSLAGSLSLLDLRLRATDSAIQLWETFLERYPQTKLRPLALYRLGWAYRYASAAGLPRESPDQAFDGLIKDYGGTPLAVTASNAKNIPWKSKSTAATRSLLPGLGQIYVGETKSGVIRLSIATAAAVAIAIPIITAINRDRDLSWSKDWPLLATGLGGLIVLSFDYTSSYEDAMRGVVQRNERAESEFNRTHPDAP